MPYIEIGIKEVILIRNITNIVSDEFGNIFFNVEDINNYDTYYTTCLIALDLEFIEKILK